MALFKYVGPPDRIWPDIPSSGDPKMPAAGDVVEWGDRVPDEACWEKAAKNAKPTKHEEPELADAAADDDAKD